MSGRIDVPIDQIQEEYDEVLDFLKEEYPNRESYGKRWIGKKMAKISQHQVRQWKQESMEVQRSWKELKGEIDAALE